MLKWIWQHKYNIIKGYFAFIGTVGFASFMLEESIQCVQFASWQIEKTGTPMQLKQVADSMKRTIHILDILNTGFGIPNPFGYIAYREYVKASTLYAEALEMKAFAQEPSLYEGHVLNVFFRPDAVSGNEGKSGTVKVITKQEMIPGRTIRVTGRVSLSGAETIITEVQ